MIDLQGGSVIITGGCGMLGREHCAAVREAKGTPIVLDVDKGLINSLESPAYAVDITDEQALAQVSETILNEHGTPIGLVNNAAIDSKFDGSDPKAGSSRLEDFPLGQWDRELQVSLTGAMLCARFFGCAMAKAGRGAIVNIASDLGVIAPDQRLYQQDGVPADQQAVKPVTYSVIKHGLIGLTRYLATYWAEQGVRCNALAPGGVFNEHPDEFVQRVSERVPLGRMARRDEFHNALQFLISDASSYMTGQTLVMDGGRSTW